MESQRDNMPTSPFHSAFTRLSQSLNGDDSTDSSSSAEVEMKAKAEAAWKSFTASASSAAKMAKSASVDAAKKAAASAKKAGINVPDAIVPQHDPASDEENLVGSALGPEAQQAVDGVTDEIRSHCPALTYKQRLYGALSCIGIGFLMSVGATLALLGGKDHLSDYAVLYTLGNVCSICGSGFVVGPCRQAKLMFKPVRRVACMIYLSTMIATVFVAIYYADILLIFSLLIIQYCALIWYGASFIPFGRTCIAKACKKGCSYAGSSMGVEQ